MTGTFDDWGKTQKLEKVGSHFEKNVRFSKIDEKIYYKVCAERQPSRGHESPVGVRMNSAYTC